MPEDDQNGAPEAPEPAQVPATDPQPVPAEPVPAPKRSKKVPIAIAVAVAVIAAGVGAFFLLKGGGGAKTPEEAVQGFYAALASGDCTEAAKFTDPTWADEAATCKGLKDWKQSYGTLGKVESSDVQSDAAYLVLSAKIGGISDQRIATVNKTPDDTWGFAGTSACYGEEAPEDLGNEHLDDGETFTAYSSDPPTSGPHAGTPAEMGHIFTSPQPNEALVHSLEHGAVIFWSNLEGPLAKKGEEAVKDVFFQGYENLIFTPKPDLDVPFAMTAWGTLQKCVGVEATEIQTFVDTHYGQGIEGFVACSGSAAELPGCKDA